MFGRNSKKKKQNTEVIVGEVPTNIEKQATDFINEKVEIINSYLQKGKYNKEITKADRQKEQFINVDAQISTAKLIKSISQDLLKVEKHLNKNVTENATEEDVATRNEIIKAEKSTAQELNVSFLEKEQVKLLAKQNEYYQKARQKVIENYLEKQTSVLDHDDKLTTNDGGIDKSQKPLNQKDAEQLVNEKRTNSHEVIQTPYRGTTSQEGQVKSVTDLHGTTNKQVTIQQVGNGFDTKKTVTNAGETPKQQINKTKSHHDFVLVSDSTVSSNLNVDQLKEKPTTTELISKRGRIFPKSINALAKIRNDPITTKISTKVANYVAVIDTIKKEDRVLAVFKRKLTSEQFKNTLSIKNGLVVLSRSISYPLDQFGVAFSPLLKMRFVYFVTRTLISVQFIRTWCKLYCLLFRRQIPRVILDYEKEHHKFTETGKHADREVEKNFYRMFLHPTFNAISFNKAFNNHWDKKVAVEQPKKEAKHKYKFSPFEMVYFVVKKVIGIFSSAIVGVLKLFIL